MKDISNPDQRWNTRKPLRLEVSIALGNHQALHLTTQNVSMGGMFLEPSTEKLGEGNTLTIAFSLKTRQGVSRHRLPVRVARESPQGTALVFDDYDMETVHMLREVLYDGALEY